LCGGWIAGACLKASIPLAFQELAAELSVCFPEGKINTASSSTPCIYAFRHGLLNRT
jgi:hypothetical protein